VLTVPYLVALTALFALAYRSRPRIIRETVESMQKLFRIAAAPARSDGTAR
jgi:simple sugar transport system permease protein